MATTYDPIASTTLTSSASSVTFSSIPTDGTYRDLVLIISGTYTTNTNAYISFNSDTSSSYYQIYAVGNGSTASSDAYGPWTEYRLDFNGSFRSTPNLVKVDIMDCSATDKHKSVLTRVSQATYDVEMSVGRWANTSAISSLRVRFDAAILAGSTFSLYGIAA